MQRVAEVAGLYRGLQHVRPIHMPPARDFAHGSCCDRGAAVAPLAPTVAP